MYKYLVLKIRDNYFLLWGNLFYNYILLGVKYYIGNEGLIFILSYWVFFIYENIKVRMYFLEKSLIGINFR